MLRLIVTAMFAAPLPVSLTADELTREVDQLYQKQLDDLFKHFHTYPELSMLQNETAKRMASELHAAGQ